MRRLVVLALSLWLPMQRVHGANQPENTGLPAAAAVAATAELPEQLTLKVGPTEMAFVLIPAGTFTMGSPEATGDADESPQHPVTISTAFYLGRYEVTQEQWQAVMGTNPSQFKGPRRPVDSVSWNECQRFLQKLRQLTRRELALPTEAQWEYASRAGTDTAWSFGRNADAIDAYAWWADNSEAMTHPVGEKRPNAFGLYDTIGNVSEWTADWYTKHAYPDHAVSDPARPGPIEKSSPVCRGGAWGDGLDFLRSACRNCVGADNATSGLGLRCVLRVSPALTASRTPAAK